MEHGTAIPQVKSRDTGLDCDAVEFAVWHYRLPYRQQRWQDVYSNWCCEDVSLAQGCQVCERWQIKPVHLQYMASYL